MSAQRDSSGRTDTERAVIAEIRARMGAARITQTQLAAHIGMAQPDLSRRLDGTRPLRLGEVDEIARALGITGADLIVSAVDRWGEIVRGR